MKRFWRMYQVEQKIFFRSPDVFLFCLAMPVVVLILIAMIAGNKNAADSGLTFFQSAYVALSTVGICCSAFMSIPITVVELRSQGILRRMYCSPCSPARLLACDTICSGVIAATSTLILTIAAVVFFGATIPAEVFPAWFQSVAKLMPLGIGIDLLKSVSMGCYDKMAVPVMTLIAIAVVCGMVAVKTFRWE